MVPFKLYEFSLIQSEQNKEKRSLYLPLKEEDNKRKTVTYSSYSNPTYSKYCNWDTSSESSVQSYFTPKGDEYKAIISNQNAYTYKNDVKNTKSSGCFGCLKKKTNKETDVYQKN